MPNYNFRNSGMRRKQNFEKVSLPPRLLLFAFSPPRFFDFLSPFFSLCSAFTMLPVGGKRFSKKFEDREFFLEVGLGSGTRFSLDFSRQSYWVFCIFLWSVWLNHAHLGMVWKISPPCTRSSWKLSRTVKTDDVTNGTRDVVKQGRLWAVQGSRC